MKTISVTELRGNLYKIIDAVIASGEPLVIKRKEVLLLVKPIAKKAPKK